MKKKATISAQDVEHRGLDGEATKNFSLEMKIVRELNDPSLVEKQKKVTAKNIKSGGL